jgi:hypothetical protein
VIGVRQLVIADIWTGRIACRRAGGDRVASQNYFKASAVRASRREVSVLIIVRMRLKIPFSFSINACESVIRSRLSRINSSDLWQRSDREIAGQARDSGEAVR